MSEHADDQLLSLQEAAERLHVHYMTAYRWVRRGELPAFKTGGRLRIRVGDLREFMSERRIEVALPSGPGRTDWPTHRDRLYQLLLDGDSVGAGQLVRRVGIDGAAAGDIYLFLLTPVLHRIGDSWSEGEVSTAHEHRATAIASQLVARLSPAFRRRGPLHGVAVTCTPSGELHAIGIRMVSDFLRGVGYDTHHLGPNLPADELAGFLRRYPADVVAVSVSNGVPHGELAALVRAAAGARVIVGGGAARPDVVTELGAVHCPDLGDLQQVLAAGAAGAHGAAGNGSASDEGGSGAE